ncbi:putative repeat protein (TIGR01451 family) [Marmoricola sp. OAE513]|uniref:DUF7507 domain-containing protein n=1 Tax=Marmoricola sp. OAE513 TaxID=2817894 RepID=UPI001AEA9B5A
MMLRTRRSSGGRALVTRFTNSGLALAVVAMALVAFTTPQSVTADRTTPVAAGVPAAGVPLFSEDFSNQSATSSGIPLTSYVGTSGMLYTADTPYLPAGGQCNGWVMNSSTPRPTTAQDAGCNNNQPAGWQQLQAMAAALGTAQGMTAAQAASNQVLTEYTNKASGTIAAGYELKTSSTIVAQPGHYYAISAYFAEVNCFAAHAKMTFSLLVNGVADTLGTGANETPLDPCTFPGGQLIGETQVAKLQSGAIRMPLTGTANLGFQLYNNTTSGSGNDVSFDLPQIVDVTPTVDKSFSPALIGPGGKSTLTITVTNTTDLQAKNDWTITDNLPSGLVVAAAPNLGGTCKNNAAAGSVAYSATAAAGSSTINVVGGDIPAGQTSCTITVDVTAAAEGTYTNGPSNVDTNLLPPTPATLVVRAPRITLVKTLGTARKADTDEFTMQIRTGSATGTVVSSATNATTAGSGSTVTSGTGTTGAYVATAGTPYFLTEAASGTTSLPAYGATITCTDSKGLQTGLPNGAAFSGSLTLTPVAGADITCTLSNSALPAPVLNVSKTAGTVTGPDANGNYQVTHDVKVTNSGNATGTYTGLTDTPAFAANLKPTAASWSSSGSGAAAAGTASPFPASSPYTFTIVPSSTSIAAGVTHTYTVTTTFRYTDLVQATACAGSGTGLYNSAALSGTQEQGVSTDNAACVPPPTPPSPALTIDKRVASISDANTNSRTDTGDKINYAFDVKNTGNVTLTSVSVADTLVAPAGPAVTVTCPKTTLVPGEQMTCTASAYTVTAADMNAGSVRNSATATGTPPVGSPVTTGPDTTTTPLAQSPALTIDKKVASVTDVNGNGRTDAGDRITYTFDVKNAGDVTLTSVNVSDTFVAPAAPALSITCPKTTLVAGELMTCTAAVYTITAADVGVAQVDNAATATGTPPTGAAITTPPDTTHTPITQTPALTIDKKVASVTDANGNGRTDTGDRIAYVFDVKNTGDVALTAVSVTDVLVAPAGPEVSVTCPKTSLAVGELMTCTASTYTVTSADLNTGAVKNSATAKGTPPSGTAITTPPDTTTTPLTQSPSLTLDKKVASITDVNGNGKTDVGDKINYAFDLKNAGDVTLTSVGVLDTFVAPAGPALTITCPKTTLVAGESMTCTAAPYTITTADLGVAQVDNTATASGTPPSGPVVTTPPDTTHTPVAQSPALTLDKRVASVTDVNGNGRNDAGDKITYAFDVKNTGDVTLTGVSVTDAFVAPAGPAITVTCPKTTLVAGESMTCTATAYTVTAADVGSGAVKNSATASGTSPSGAGLTTPPDATSTPLVQTPALTLDKRVASVTDVNGNGRNDAGDRVNWVFDVKNTGDVTLTGVSVTDVLTAPAAPEVTVTCPKTTLVAGELMTCTATAYTATSADVTAGAVKNSATATGTPPSGGPISTPPDTTTTPLVQSPALTIDKKVASITDLNGNGKNDAGDRINWVFDVKNTGDVPLTSVSVSDVLVAPANPAITVSCPKATLAVGELMTCTASGYTVTGADVDAGAVKNSATATGTPPSGTPVTTPPDTTTTPLVQGAALTIDKRVASVTDLNGNGRNDAGDRISYVFDVTNTGNVTLTSVGVTDTLVAPAGPEVSVTCPKTALAPGETMTCTASPYTVTGNDVTAGAVKNSATATGTPPAGGPITTPPDATTTPLVQSPSLTIDKKVSSITDVNGNGKNDAGDRITYAFDVKNVGDVPLTAVSVTDVLVAPAGPAVSVTCPKTALTVGELMTCTASPYTVTSSDVNAGAVKNSATATGTPPTGGPVTTAPDTTTTPLVQSPSLTIDKKVASITDLNGNGKNDAGDRINYVFDVKNAGDVTLTSVSVADTLVAPAGPEVTVTCPKTTLVAGESMTCTASAYVITGADVGNGKVDNSATATGTPPTGGPVTTPPDTTSTPLVQSPALSLDKKVASITDLNGNGKNDAGDRINWVFDVKNTGDVTLTSVSVTDTLVAPAGPEVTVTCPKTTLTAGESMTCTASSYLVTLADVGAGAVKNSATATGTPPTGGPVTTPPDTTTTPLVQSPSLTIDKKVASITDVNGNGKNDAGDKINYVFDVKNAGDVTLTSVNVTDTLVAPAGPEVTVTCPKTTLAAGELMTCTASAYTITAADVDATTVKNSATATGTPPTGAPITTPPDTTTTPLTQSPGLAIDKKVASITDANGNGKTDAGDKLNYIFDVKNTGDVTLTSVSVTDILVAPAAPAVTVTCPKTTLVAGETMSCTATAYVVTSSDIGAGAVKNSATATGNPPSGAPITTAPDTTTTPLVQSPSLTIDKKVASITDVNGNGKTDAGDRINYVFDVENAGDVTLTGVSVADVLVAPAGPAVTVTCPKATLAAGETMTCTASAYVVTAADVDAGAVKNSATATGTPPSGAPITTAPDTTTTPLAQSSSLTLDKKVASITDVNGNGKTDAGDKINYTFDVSNAGTVTLSGISVTDTLVSPAGPAVTVTCPKTTLAAGESMTCSASAYVITAADVTNGKVDNAATATGTPPTGSPITTAPDTTSTPLAQAPALTLDKRVASVTDLNGNGKNDAGDRISYAFDVKNTGDVTLTSVGVTDVLVAPAAPAVAVSCPKTALVPGESMTCTASGYVATTADVAAGAVKNSATATGTPPTGSPITTAPDSTTTPLVQSPSLTIDKKVASITDVNGNGRTDAGDRITYSFDVQNVGNVALSSVAVTDVLVAPAGPAVSVTCPKTTLALGELMTCTASAYTVTGADVDAGAVKNSATATGTPPSGMPVTTGPDTTTTPLVQSPSLTIDKKVASITDVNGNGKTDAGDRINYVFDVKNAGDVTLTSVGVADVLVAPAGPAVTVTCPQTSLAPGGSMTCTASPYTVTAGDVSVGSVKNSATATGTPPNGTPVTTPPDSTTTPLVQTSALTLDKRVASITDVNGNGKNDAGDRISFAFDVKNTGDTALSAVTVDDVLVAPAGPRVTVVCPKTTLAAGESMTCAATPYVVTAADVDAGAVKNSATATGTPPTGTPITTAPDTTTTPLVQSPLLTLDKKVGSVTDVNGNGKNDAGDKIVYLFDLKNQGDVTLTGVTVNDTLVAPAGPAVSVTCPKTTLAAGESMTCTSSAYTVTSSDVSNGKVDNGATAAGTPPSGPVVTTPEDTTSTPLAQSSSLTIDKKVASITDVNGNGKTDVGDKISYAFDVKNAGDSTLTAVAVVDVLVAPAGPAVSVTCPKSTLVAGESMTCTASPYTVTGSDVDAGAVKNSATATGTPPSGTPITSPPDTTTTPLAQGSSLTIDKKVASITDANGNGKNDVGDRINYVFDVKNTGDVTLTSVGVLDTFVSPAGPAVAVTCPKSTLVAGESMTCTASPYTITSADADASTVKNSATATGTPPTGTPITTPPDTTSTTVDQAPSLTVDKKVASIADANGNGKTDAGDRISYVFDVKNTGNVTLTSVSVQDTFVSPAGPALTLACPKSVLAAGESMTCAATPYVVTAADVDAGAVKNAATATGTPPTGSPVTTPPDTTTTPVVQSAALTVDKKVASIADVNGNGKTDAGDKITYAFDVTNAGNVSLTGISVSDVLVAPAGPAVTVTCPKGTLAAGESMTCTATAYTVTAADVNAGAVKNSATATGTPPTGTPISTPPDTTTTPVVQSAVLTVDKKVASVSDLNLNGRTDAGDKISYTFDVTNAGNVSLTGISVSDVLVAPAGPAVTVTCPKGTLAAGESMTCTSSAYTVTSADVGAGAVKNSATATGTPPSGTPITTPPDTTTTPVAQTPSLTVDKKVASITDVNDNGKTDAGDKIAYTFDVKNVGDVTLTAVSIQDTFVAPAGPTVAVTCPKTTLVAGESMTCTASSYTITSQDVDAAAVRNTATASGTPPTGGPVTSPPDTTTTPVVQSSGLSVDKKVAAVTDLNNNGKTDAGDRVSYTFDVRNTGTVTLTGISVSDTFTAPAGPALTVTCPKSTLAAGESMTCTASPYVVTAADVTTGAVKNTATATGTPPSGPPVTTPPDSTTTPVVQTPSLKVDKKVSSINDTNGNGKTDAGDLIAYVFEVENAGNVALTNVGVTDTLVAPAGPEVTVTCPKTALAAGESMTCTATPYKVTAADVAAGKVDNAATAQGTPPTGSPIVTPPDTTHTPIDRSPSLTVEKKVASIADANGNAKTDAGDRISYIFVVTNDGDVPLSGVSVTDKFVAPAGPALTVSCPKSSLAVGESMTCASSPYVVTAADVDAGAIKNSATATGTPSGGSPLTTPPSTTSTPVAQTSLLRVDKKVASIEDVNGNARTDAGDKITYAFEVQNTGNVSLTGIVVTDTFTAPAGPALAVTCPRTTLAAGASMTCTAGAYTITAADVRAGRVDNTATATGTPPSGPPVTTPPDSVHTPVLPVAKLEVDKKVGSIDDVNGNTKTDAGDTITYAFVVRNSGDVDVSDVSVTDTLVAPAGPALTVTCPATTLAAGASMTCTSSPYLVTAADVDSGAVKNSATVTGTPPSGPPVTSPPDTTSTPLSQAVSISLVKVADKSLVVAGETILYTFTATNTGTVTLRDVTITEGAFTGAGKLGAVVCAPLSQPAVLAPGATLTCTAPYLVLPGDAGGKSLSNTANVVGTPPTGPKVTDTDKVVVPGSTGSAVSPGLSFDKRVSKLVDANRNGFADAGDEISYEFTVYNTGDVTMTGLRVKDPKLTAAGITTTCPKSSLAPGASMICAADEPYRITAADVRAGRAVNTANAQGTPPAGGTLDSPGDSTETPVCPSDADRVEAEACGGQVVDTPGDDNGGSGGPAAPSTQVLPATGASSWLLPAGGLGILMALTGVVIVVAPHRKKRPRLNGKHAA